MKEFMKIMEKDIRRENFSKKEFIIGAIIAPIVLIAIMGLAGWLETVLS